VEARRRCAVERARGLQTFLAGPWRRLLAYENEAIFAQKHNQPVQFVIPKATILIENPICGHVDVAAQAAGAGVRQLPAHEAGAADLR
jgi:sulfate transport system substrate-binding protein